MRETGLKCISFSGVSVFEACAHLETGQLMRVVSDPQDHQRVGSSPSAFGR